MPETLLETSKTLLYKHSLSICGIDHYIAHLLMNQTAERLTAYNES